MLNSRPIGKPAMAGLFGLLILCILLGTILPAFSPMMDMFTETLLHTGIGPYLLLCVTSFWIVVLVLNYLFNFFTLTKSRTIIISASLLLLSFAARLIYVFHFDQAYYNDFRAYWTIASNMVTNGFIPVNNIHIQRALAFYYPLIYLFGDSDIVFKIANVVLITLTTAITAYISGKWISFSSAITAILIISIIPETYNASLIPSHDITGSFYLMLCFLCVFRILNLIAYRKYLQSLLTSFILSLLIILMELQRGLIQLFVIASIFSMLLYSLPIVNHNYIKSIKYGRFLLYSLLFIVILPYFSYDLFYHGFKGRLICERDTDRQIIRWNTLNDGTYNSQIRILEGRLVSALPDDPTDRSTFSKSLFLSDLYYDPLQRIPNFFLRSERLLTLGSQLYFYLSRLRNTDNLQIANIRNNAKMVNSAFYSLFLFMIIISVIFMLLFMTDISPVMILFIVFMSGGVFALSVIGENQPRYLFMGYYLWPVFIGGALSKFFQNPKIPELIRNRYAVCPRLSRYAILTIPVFCLFAVCLYSLFKWDFQNSSLKLLNLSHFSNITCSPGTPEEVCTKGRLPFENSTSQRDWSLLKLGFPTKPKPTDSVRVEHTFPVHSQSKHALGLFVQHPNISGRNLSKMCRFEIVISANNQRKVFKYLSSREIQYILLDNITPINNSVNISIELGCLACSAGANCRKASLTHFQFARLYPMR